jgi:NADH-quinone oxidoreductase subunit J
MFLLILAVSAAMILLSGVALVVTGAVEAGGDASSIVLFTLLAFLLIASGLAVILERSPIRSAMALIVTLFLLAVMFVTLDAPLLAALQIIVYAGAIMVLFLFVIMLLNLQREPGSIARLGRLTGGILGGSLFLLGAVRVFLTRAATAAARLPGPGMTSPVAADFGTIETLGRSLFTQFLLAFELTSVVLLVAIVGALVLAKRTWA